MCPGGPVFVSVGPMPPPLKCNQVKLLKVYPKPIAFYHRIGRLLSAYAMQELLHLLLYETLVLYIQFIVQPSGMPGETVQVGYLRTACYSITIKDNLD